MTDKIAQHPIASVLHYHDGTVLMYAKAAQNIKKNDLVKANANGSVIAYTSDELRMPEAMAIEDVGVNEYSFFLVKGGINAPKGSIEV